MVLPSDGLVKGRNVYDPTLEMRTPLLPATFLLLTASLLTADTLVLRNGRRIEGQLVRVRDDRIEFEDRNGRRSEYDRDQLERIEFGWSGGGERPRDHRPGPA